MAQHIADKNLGLRLPGILPGIASLEWSYHMVAEAVSLLIHSCTNFQSNFMVSKFTLIYQHIPPICFIFSTFTRRQEIILLITYIPAINATPGRIPSYFRIIIIQLENHKLIKSGVVDSTGLHSLSTCSAYETYCKEIQQSIPHWTKKTQ